MKVFISHKAEDSAIALRLNRAFIARGIPTYLDVLDLSISNGGKALTDRIKKQLNDCTDIIVVMSEKTKKSWWVPFEVGLAANTDKPMASFLVENVALPEYLAYWPRLRDPSDVDLYLYSQKQVSEAATPYLFTLSPEMRKKRETASFHDQLKKELNKKYGV